MHGALNSARCQSFMHKSDTGRTLLTPTRQTSWTFLRQTTHPANAHLRNLFWPYLPGGTLALTVSHPSGTICNESEQHFFTCTSSASPQLEHTHKRTVVPDAHTTAPTTGELFNAIRPLDRPLASISTHARSSELGSLSVIHAQVRHGTDPSHTDRTNLTDFLKANNPP